jgi:hypothetical protein
MKNIPLGSIELGHFLGISMGIDDIVFDDLLYDLSGSVL